MTNLLNRVKSKQGHAVLLIVVSSSHLLLHYTGRTLHRYHARVCGYRSGVIFPELLKMFSHSED